MNVPNALTLFRVLLIPVFVILVMDHLLGWALFIFALAGITDGADGLIARLTHQRTELGAYLDPIADKLLLSSAFITLAIFELLPNWLTVIVIARDVIILVGILVMILNHYEVKIDPSLMSKVTTTFQISTILLVLMKGYGPLFESLSTIGIYGTTVFTILSGAHYIYVGTRILNEKKEHSR